MIHRHPTSGWMMMMDSVQTRVDQESELTTYGNQSGPVDSYMLEKLGRNQFLGIPTWECSYAYLEIRIKFLCAGPLSAHIHEYAS